MDQTNKHGLSKRLHDAGHWLEGRADPLLGLVLGVAAALAGLFGWIKGDTLAAATLIVLSVVAFALLRERSLRIDANKALGELNESMDDVHESVASLHGRSPYHVVRDESEWDLVEKDGSLVHVRRTKRIKFDQDEVLSLYDWGSGDGTEDEPQYTGATKVDTFQAEGKTYALLSLRRFYPRGHEMTLGINRTHRDALTKDQERININSLDQTKLLVMKIVWPADRPPSAVRLNHTTADGVRTSQPVDSRVVTGADGRKSYRVEVENPERRGLTTIEWDW